MKIALYISISKDLEALEYNHRAPSVQRKAPFGYCPTCQGVGAIREKREHGMDTCVNGHTYSSSQALKTGIKRVCPEPDCGAAIKSSQKSYGGTSTCNRGHIFPSSKALEIILH